MANSGLWPLCHIVFTRPKLLDGLLGNDLLGFHLSYHCQNFLETVDRNLEARTDREISEVQRGGHATRVRPFPISIDFERQPAAAAGAEVEREAARWRHRPGLHGSKTGPGRSLPPSLIGPRCL
ncbi:MAG: trehalose-6-phosphate synthase [Isosphaeraceae bacterium]